MIEVWPVLLPAAVALFLGTRVLGPELARLSSRGLFRYGTVYGSFLAVLYTFAQFQEARHPSDKAAGKPALWALGVFFLVYVSALWRASLLQKKNQP